MNRMDKYNDETPELKRRIDKYSNLYDADNKDYDKFDVDSNVSVLQDNARSIDVDQIRAMLDKKYRDNIPKRKSIQLDTTEDDEVLDAKQVEAKDYDLNVILDKAKANKKVSYEEERFTRGASTSEKLIEEINRKYKPKDESEEAAELLNLINTITELELKNQNKNNANNETDDDVDMPNVIAAEKIAKNADEDMEETFYTGKLAIKDNDFDDFKEIQDDIKSNSIVIKVLIFIFVIIILCGAVFAVNKYFNLGLF